MTVYFELTSAQVSSARMALQPGLQRIKTAVGDRYRIVDDATGRTPPDIVVKRFDSHMIIEGLPDGASVELTDFYARCGVSSPCTLAIESDTSLAGDVVEISPASPPLQALTDGSFVVYPSSYTGAPAIAVADSEGISRATVYAVGGLAIAALAGAAGGGGGGSAPTAVSATPAPPPPAPDPASAPAPVPAPTLAPSPAPVVLDLIPPGQPVVTSENTSSSRTPTITGIAEPGAQMKLEIDTNRDGRAEAVYRATADAGSQWQVDLGTAQPAAGSLPPGGLPVASASLMTVTATDSSQNESSAAQFAMVVQAPQNFATVTAVTDDAAPRTGNVASGAATNDDTPTLSGRLSSPLAVDETVQVLRNGVVVSATVAVDGVSWRVTDGHLADGTYTYIARVVDVEGAGPSSAGYSIVLNTMNGRTASITSVFDDASPGVGTVREGGTTNDTTPTLTGRLSSSLVAGEELQILRDDAVISTSAGISGSSWSFTDRVPGDGDYDYAVRVVDAAANIGRESATFNLRVSSSRRGRGDKDDDDDQDDDDDDALDLKMAAGGGTEPLTIEDLSSSDGYASPVAGSLSAAWTPSPSIDSLLNP